LIETIFWENPNKIRNAAMYRGDYRHLGKVKQPFIGPSGNIILDKSAKSTKIHFLMNVANFETTRKKKNNNVQNAFLFVTKVECKKIIFLIQLFFIVLVL